MNTLLNRPMGGEIMSGGYSGGNNGFVLLVVLFILLIIVGSNYQMGSGYDVGY